MAIDLSSGMEASRDHFLGDRPDDDEFRESASVWISDDQGAIGLPRVGIESLASSWDKRDLQMNLCFPDGRAVIVREPGEGRSPVDPDGICRRFQAGGLEFHHAEPFKNLTVTYRGAALDTTAAALARGDMEAPRIDVDVKIEMTCAAPPWISGTLSKDAAELFNDGFAGAFISPRYEQLCTVKGDVKAGDDKWSFTGTGLRIHRQGRRDTGGFWGHCWPSALFPSGRGFGGLAFPENPDGQSYNEAYIFDGERMIPATLVDAPWLRRLQPYGEDVAVTLRTEDGHDVRIEGTTVLTSCMAGGSHVFAPALQQAGVRYTWDGEVSYGMMERSIPVDQLQA